MLSEPRTILIPDLWPPSSPFRWLSPVRLREALLLAPLLLFIATRPLTMPTDPDYWWHIRTGQLIVETGALPRGDPFSHTVTGQPWVTHEWLTEVLFFLVARQVGYVGLAVLFGLLGALTWLFVYLTCRQWGVGEVGALLLVLWGWVIGIGVANVRPQALTACLTAVFAFILTRYRRGESSTGRFHGRSLWLLPGLMVLWVNLHGGYLIGLVLLGLALTGEAVRRWLFGAETPLRPLLRATVLTTVATLLNPHGLEALRYPFTYAGTANASMRYVAEWQSPNFHEPLGLLFASSLLVVLVLGVGRRPLGPTEVLWTLLFAAMGLQAVRHLALYAVVVTPLLGARLQAEIPAFRRPLAAWRRPALLFVTWLLLVALLLGLLLSPERRADLQLGREPLARTYPAGAVAYLKAHDLPGNLFNDYDWGGYLIYHLFPRWPVFIDGRMDVYGDHFPDQVYFEVVWLRPGWRAILDQYNIRLVLIRRTSALATVLSADPAWTTVYTGEVEQLFVRKEPAP